jgi:hypothetical protein
MAWRAFGEVVVIISACVLLGLFISISLTGSP